ncbi:MAG: hypothetical protein ABUT39_27495 [Acidobacteriota bacterium]
MIRDALSLFTAILALAAFPRDAAAQACPNPLFAPYVFVLMDTSGSLNYSPPCSSTQLANGDCPFLCPTGDCFVPLQGDDPASKLRQMKDGLYSVISARSDAQLGFATFNQDQFYARAKHWLYQAQGNGPSLPGGGSYPATGAQEVFGYLWSCDTGSNDNEIGCLPTKPADLPDAWELTRVQRLPKGGTLFNQNVTFYIRQSPTTYRVTYTPAVGGTLGTSTVTTTVRVDKCNTSSCTSTTLIGQQSVSWSLATDFLPWDNALPTNTNRTDPMITFFDQPAATDASAGNTCSGWDPNTDTTSDRFNGYTLRWPTDATDPRGAALTKGDVIPWDWQQDHNAHVQMRLAPNLSGFPGTPDFRIATYLRDLPQVGENFLRLKDETKRPLIAVGSTPQANSLQGFRNWYSSWKSIAMVQDPDWLCRKRVVIVLTDGDETCGVSPCSIADSLWQLDGVQVYAVGYGSDPMTSPQLDCIASNGGSTSALRPGTKQELIDTLNAVIDAAQVP